MRGGRLEDLFEYSDYDNQEILENNPKIPENPENPEELQNQNIVGRKLMDAYGDSMLHVHRLLTKHYGFSNR